MAHALEPLDLLDDLDDSLSVLTSTLAPLLSTPLSDVATSLTVADKARLHVLATYALDSLLFSYLRLQGTNTKNHAIMTELTRVRQYVAKIKGAEPATERPMALDKQAAGRFIKAGLAGNDKYDVERAEQVRAQKEGAMEKLVALDEKSAKAGSPKESEEGDGSGGGGEKNRKAKKSKAGKETRREERKEKRKDVRKKNKDLT
ncbi:exosome-associated protein [Tricharina praecox]|uniref:exosome-associated protein n=1 Tax=Tricharina praecox TaxID=43433 RepID=UPI002220E6B6|nr:exosome-associated protein [Tricharina praecox]KAI5844784.1 exosome-associated protein [Tricharina praecox]